MEISVFGLRERASSYIGGANHYCLTLRCTTGSREEYIKAWTKVGCLFLAWVLLSAGTLMLKFHGLMLHPLEVLLSSPTIYPPFAVLCFSRQSIQGALLRRKLPREKSLTVTAPSLFSNSL